MEEQQINDKYKGRNSVAIIRYQNKYYLMLEMNMERLNQRFIKEKLSNFNYDIVKIYDGINGDAHQIIQEACIKLGKGKKVNLEKLLR